MGSPANERVEHAVGNLVGQLVGMAHADRFAGEQELAGCHGSSPPGRFLKRTLVRDGGRANDSPTSPGRDGGESAHYKLRETARATGKRGRRGRLSERERTARRGELIDVSARIRRINCKTEELVESHFLSLRGSQRTLRCRALGTDFADSRDCPGRWQCAGVPALQATARAKAQRADDDDRSRTAPESAANSSSRQSPA